MGKILRVLSEGLDSGAHSMLSILKHTTSEIDVMLLHKFKDMLEWSILDVMNFFKRRLDLTQNDLSSGCT